MLKVLLLKMSFKELSNFFCLQLFTIVLFIFHDLISSKKVLGIFLYEVTGTIGFGENLIHLLL